MRSIIIGLIGSFISVFTMNAQEPSKIKITIGTNSFVATLYDNASAQAFAALLPLTVNMNELNGNEKYHYLSVNLPTSTESLSTIHNGDLMLYGSNCIVLFYETFNSSYSYSKIGKIDNPTALNTALGMYNPSVLFELLSNSSNIIEAQTNHRSFKISSDGILQCTESANKITLLDINGKKLTSSTSQNINLKGFAKGIYLLQIQTLEPKQTKTIKFKY